MATVTAVPPTPPPTTPGTTTPAGEKKLAEVEAALAQWDAFEIRVAAKNEAELKAQGKELNDRKIELLRLLIELHESGGQQEWMAAKLRFGDVQYSYLLKLSQIPIPAFLTTAHANQVRLNSSPPNLQDVSEAQREWAHLVTVAKQHGISNKWSQSAEVRLNIVFPNALPPVP